VDMKKSRPTSIMGKFKVLGDRIGALNKKKATYSSVSSDDFAGNTMPETIDNNQMSFPFFKPKIVKAVESLPSKVFLSNEELPFMPPPPANAPTQVVLNLVKQANGDIPIDDLLPLMFQRQASNTVHKESNFELESTPLPIAQDDVTPNTIMKTVGFIESEAEFYDQDNNNHRLVLLSHQVEKDPDMKSPVDVVSPIENGSAEARLTRISFLQSVEIQTDGFGFQDIGVEYYTHEGESIGVQTIHAETQTDDFSEVTTTFSKCRSIGVIDNTIEISDKDTETFFEEDDLSADEDRLVILESENIRLLQELKAMQLMIVTARSQTQQMQILKEAAEARFEQLARVCHRLLTRVLQ
jgi:hypothetical protein